MESMISFFLTKTPLVFFVQPFWRDEAFSFILANKSLLDILIYTARDFNPPLYYIILHFWIKVFGSSEIALRSLSLLFFSLTLYVCYDFLKGIFKLSTSKSLLYLLIFLVNPLLGYFAFEARMYMMFAFFTVLSYYAFYSRRYKLYILSTILSLYTHYFMLFVLLSQLVFYFFSGRKKHNDPVIKYIYLCFILFLPWVLFVFSQGQFFTTSFWIYRINSNTLINLFGVLYLGFEQGTGYFRKELQIVTIMFSAMLIFTLFSLKKESKEKQKIFLYLFIWSVGTALLVGVISFVKPIFIPRYLIFSTLGFIFLTVFMSEEILSPFRWVIVFILIFFSLNFQRFQIQQKRKSDIRKIVNEIRMTANKNDVIYVADELDYFTLQYYYDKDRVYIYNKSYDEIPQFVGKSLIPKDRIVASLPSYPKKAFVLNRNGTYVIQSLY